MDLAPATRESRTDWDEARFEEFFRATYVRLARAMLLMTGSPAEAEDLAQEAEARVYERWTRVRRMESPEGYLYRTAMSLDRKRRRALSVRSRRRAMPGDAADPLDATELRIDLIRLVRGLPEAQRTAVVLVELAGMTAEQAGQVLGIAPTSVRTRLHRAREALRGTSGEADG